MGVERGDAVSPAEAVSPMDPPVSLSQLCQRGLDSVVKEYFKKFDSVQEATDPFDLYEKKRAVGTGAFGMVYRVVNRSTGKKAAMKEMVLPSTEMQAENCVLWRSVMAEVAVLASIQRMGEDRENLVGLRDLRFFNGSLYLITDLAPGVTLHSYAAMNLPSERKASEICYQVLRALLSLHAMGIIHGDIKPENVMIARNPKHGDTSVQGTCRRVRAPGNASRTYLQHSARCDEFIVKLVDYGSVKFDAEPVEGHQHDAAAASEDCRESEQNPCCCLDASSVFGGTSMYLAVEIIDLLLPPAPGAKQTLGTQGLSKADMFSLGVMAFILLCRVHPFRGTALDDLHGMRAKIRQGVDFPAHMVDQLSEGVKDLLSSLLQLDPADRPNAIDALQHPWIIARGTLAPLPPCDEALLKTKLCACAAENVYTAPEERFTACEASLPCNSSTCGSVSTPSTLL